MISNNFNHQKWQLLIKDQLGLLKFHVHDNDVHLKEAAKWITRAQDATPDRGVSRAFSLPNVWQPSYPETTGYIIPTMIKYAKFSGDDEYRYRALEMADWLLDIQIECGAIQAGTIGSSPKTPTIFNTGQVLFGWVSAFNETGEEKYRQAAIKAVNWLLEVQDPDGCWSRFASPLCNSKINTYNVRTAWGILQVYDITQNAQYLDASTKNIHWALKQQNDLGWFENNCLDNNSQPLLHTIGYTIEGLAGVGAFLNNQVFIDAAEKALRALISCQAPDGSLPGRFDWQWKPTVKWRCLTGVAQIAICWWILDSITKNSIYSQAAIKANNLLKSHHNLSTSNPGIRGGIKGSHPINGKYCSYEYPNWAAKFFMDSLLLEEQNL